MGAANYPTDRQSYESSSGIGLCPDFYKSGLFLFEKNIYLSYNLPASKPVNGGSGENNLRQATSTSSGTNFNLSGRSDSSLCKCSDMAKAGYKNTGGF
jgi:hypothetical protein